MRRVLRILLVVVILAGAGAGYYYWRLRQQTPIQDLYQTVAAERGDLVATIGATGVVRSNQNAVLTWQTTGTVDLVNVSEGDQVAPAQVLATLRQTSLPQTVILAEVDLNTGRKTLEDLKTNAATAKITALQSISTYAQAVKSAQYELDNFTIPTAQASLDAMEALQQTEERLNQARDAFEPYKFRPSGDSTRQKLKEALDLAQSDYNAAVRRLELETNLEAATANLEKAKQDFAKWANGPDPADIANANARIAAAQATLGLAQISAPFAGTITLVQVKPGDQVNPGKIAFQIDDLSRLLVDVSVSEVDINRVQVGQEVTLTFDGVLGKEYKGVVDQVSRVGSATQGIVDFIVTVGLTNPDEQVKSGMTAAVSIVVNQLKSVLQVPNRAVRIVNSNRVVYILKGDQLVPVTITLGASSDLASEVQDGDLQVGDLIVLNPPVVFESNGPPPFVRR
jgi:HlyD family secretion protein